MSDLEPLIGSVTFDTAPAITELDALQAQVVEASAAIDESLGRIDSAVGLTTAEISSGTDAAGVSFDSMGVQIASAAEGADAGINTLQASADRLATVATSAEGVSTSVEGMAASIEAATPSTDALATSSDALSTSTDVLTTSLGGVRDVLPEVATELDTTAGGADETSASMDTTASSGGALSSVFAALRDAIGSVVGELPGLSAGMDAAAGSMDKADASADGFIAKTAAIGKTALIGVAGGIAAVGAVSVKMGMDFQSSMTELQTGAGEAQKNIGEVSQGILTMAAKVGQTPEQLAKGMFLIESAGDHGATGLQVLKAAAEGAATGGAQMTVVANALTTALHDYGLSATHANNVTSALIETVASGKTHLTTLAGSLGKVMPVASALGVSFQTVTGAIAAMTNAGLSARLASMGLNNTLLALSAPSSTAAKSLTEVGLTTQQVKDTLDGPGGLTAAFQLIETHVSNKFPKGSVTAVTAFKNIMGGVTGYKTELMLSGANQQAFETNVKNIGGALDGSSKSVQGFTKTQKDLKFQLDQAKAALESVVTAIGVHLIPILEKGIVAVGRMITWLEKHKSVAEALGIAIGVTLTAAIGVFIGTTIAEMTLLDAALGGLPIIIGAITVGVVMLATHWKQVWGDIKNWFDDAVGFLRSGFGTLLVLLTGPIIASLIELALHWQAVWGAIKTVATDVWHFLYQVWENIQIDAKAVWGALVLFFYTIPKDILKVFDDAGKWLLNIGKDIINGLVQGVKDAAHLAIEAVKGVGHDIMSGVKDVLGIFSPSTVMATVGKNVMAGMSQGIVTGSKETVKQASDAAAAVVKAFGSLSSLKSQTSSLDAVKTLLKSFRTVLNTLSELPGVLAKVNLTGLATQFVGFGTSMSTALGSLKTALAGLKDTSGMTSALSSLQKIVDGLKTVGSGFVDVQNDFTKLNLHTVVSDIAQLSVINTIIPMLESMWDSLKKMSNLKTLATSLSELGKVFEDFGTMLGDLQSTVKTAAGANIPADFNTLTVVAKAMQTGLRDVWTAITADASSKWADITSSIKSLEKDFLTPLKDLAKQAGTVAKDLGKAWDQIKSDLQAKWGTVLTYVSGLPGKLIDPFKKLETTFKTVGKTLMIGLATGIKNGQSAAVNAATTAAKAAVTAVKTTTGTKSPSTVFMGIGGNFMEGLALGISGSAQLPHAALLGAISPLTAGLGNSLGGSIPAPGAGGGGGGTDITVRVTVPVYLTATQIAKVIAEPIRVATLRGKGRGTQNIYGGAAGKVLPTGA